MRMMQRIGRQLRWGDWAGNFAYPGLSFPICREKYKATCHPHPPRDHDIGRERKREVATW